jgi:sec-independent protein translocase protein TatA
MVLAAGPFGLGAPELLIILAVVVLIFGGTKLADLGGSMGKGIKEFKKNIKDEDAEAEDAKKDAAPPPVASVSTPAPPVASTSSNAVSALKCPSCEALNPANAKMCNQCGASLAAPVT